MAEEVKEEKEKGIHAKPVSLWAQIIAAVWIGGWCSFQFVKDITGRKHVDITDFIISGFAIAACFVPVYFNLVMDKIKEIKFGGKE